MEVTLLPVNSRVSQDEAASKRILPVPEMYNLDHPLQASQLTDKETRAHQLINVLQVSQSKPLYHKH